MWYVYLDDEIVAEFKSPVAAELYAADRRRCGGDARAVFDEGGTCSV